MSRKLNVSTDSNISVKLKDKFILRDTMGPIPSSNSRGSEDSSSNSSIKELTPADEKRLSKSFDAIQESKDSTTSAMKTPDDQTGDPGTSSASSTASSHHGQRIISKPNGVKIQFDPGAIQDKADKKKLKPGLAKSTRDVLREYVPNASTSIRNPEQPATENTVPKPKFNLAKSTRDILREYKPNFSASVKNREQPYQEQTIPKTTWDSDITEMDIGTNVQDKKENKGTAQCVTKCALLGILVLVIVTGMALLIHYLKPTEDPVPKGQIMDDPKDKECPMPKIKFREQIAFSCKFQEEAVDILYDAESVIIHPPPYFNNGNVTTVPLRATSSGNWEVILTDDDSVLEVKGPNASCSSSGNYSLEFLDGSDTPIYTVSVTLNIISEVSKVNVTLVQNKAENGFEIGCSTNSGCQQSFVDFFAEINKEETYLRGVNFSCKIEYNDITGYSVSCVGIIPDFLMARFEKITCRPDSMILNNTKKRELEEEVKLPDCNITTNCGYTCESYSPYYYIVDRARCDIFHICYNNSGQMELSSSFCSPGTFFNPENCACDFSKTLGWCREDGLNEGENETWCDVSITTTTSSTTEEPSTTSSITTTTQTPSK